MSKMKLVVLGPNPAWQKTLFFEEFVYGKINRAKERLEFPAGKGINFCRAASLYGTADTVLLEFSGGENGERIRQELARENWNVINIQTAGPTRCCTTCLCRKTQSMTEVIEPSFAASESEVARFLTAFEPELADAAGAAFCGTLPTGTDPLLYFHAAERLKKHPIPLLLDSYVNVEPILNSGMEVWLKINRDELAELTGAGEIRTGMRLLFAQTKVRYAAITDGPECAYWSDGKALCVYSIAKLPKIINPIGCGDTASAVWMSAALSGKVDSAEAFRLALGAASANCLTAFSGSFDPAEAKKLAEDTAICCDTL